MRSCVVNINTNLVENIIQRGGPTPANCDEHSPEGYYFFDSEVAGIGWSIANGVPVPPPAPPADPVKVAEELRVEGVESAIRTAQLGTVVPKTLAELKAMSAADYGAWFDANFDTAAKLIGLVKRLTLILIRRVV